MRLDDASKVKRQQDPEFNKKRLAEEKTRESGEKQRKKKIGREIEKEMGKTKEEEASATNNTLSI